MVGKVGKVGKPNIINILQRRLGGEGVGKGWGQTWGRGWGHQPAERAGYLKRFPTFPTVSPPLPHFLLSGTFQYIILIYMLIN